MLYYVIEVCPWIEFGIIALALVRFQRTTPRGGSTFANISRSWLAMDKGKLDRCVRKSIEAKVAIMRTVMSTHAQYVVLDSRCKHRSTAGSHTVISRSASAGQAYHATASSARVRPCARIWVYYIYWGPRWPKDQSKGCRTTAMGWPGITSKAVGKKTTHLTNNTA